MSADRETNQTMTDRDIALLLADAADEVEIGIAPYQAVIRGGRRRRARRWALATATALVIVGTSGGLALAGLRGGDGGEVTPAVTQRATQPSTPEERHVYTPQETTLAAGVEQGETWYVTVDVWGAPRTEAEAAAQLRSMSSHQEEPWDKDNASALVGKITYFVRRSFGSGDPAFLMGNSVSPQDASVGTDLQSAATPWTRRRPTAPCLWWSATSPRPRKRSPAPGRTARPPWPAGWRPGPTSTATKRRSARRRGLRTTGSCAWRRRGRPTNRRR
jgi:hypothetical protein